MRWIAGLSDGARDKLEYHWNVYKVAESALPVAKVATMLEVQSQSQHEASTDQFKDIFAPSPEKIEAFLHRIIVIVLELGIGCFDFFDDGAQARLLQFVPAVVGALGDAARLFSVTFSSSSPSSLTISG